MDTRQLVRVIQVMWPLGSGQITCMKRTTIINKSIRQLQNQHLNLLHISEAATGVINQLYL
jgi:molybdopterin-guanine dinucleotide biosynthesis protein